MNIWDVNFWKMRVFFPWNPGFQEWRSNIFSRESHGDFQLRSWIGLTHIGVTVTPLDWPFIKMEVRHAKIRIPDHSIRHVLTCFDHSLPTGLGFYQLAQHDPIFQCGDVLKHPDNFRIWKFYPLRLLQNITYCCRFIATTTGANRIRIILKQRS